MIKKQWKKTYREAVELTCQNCKKHEDEVGELEAHRIKRGYRGGTYAPNNTLMICDKCHKKIHEYEF